MLPLGTTVPPGLGPGCVSNAGCLAANQEGRLLSYPTPCCALGRAGASDETTQAIGCGRPAFQCQQKLRKLHRAPKELFESCVIVKREVGLPLGEAKRNSFQFSLAFGSISLGSVRCCQEELFLESRVPQIVLKGDMAFLTPAGP